MPALIDQHYRLVGLGLWVSTVAPARLLGAGWMLVTTKLRGIAVCAHPVQMIVDCSGFVGAESGA